MTHDNGTDVPEETTGLGKQHWYLVSYTAHNPYDQDTMHAVTEVPLDHLWKPGTLDKVVRTLGYSMVAMGYQGYTRPIVTHVYYMGVFDA